ncbi:unnamed protein product [Lactuca saligna]|uniref:GRAM domain-containing protein n=1 Tax=Lactuca saligna TaxID=75948 RepID=A0AA36DXP4_LACSI|nr:unnamed protein product [Lactuca saligna]
MDQRFSKYETGVAIKSTRGLLLSKPYEPHYPLSTTSSKINGIKREASSGPKLIEIMKEMLSHGAKMIQVGSQRKIFRKTFSIREGEKLLKASECNLYTTAGKLLKFQYKVSIPLGKIKGVRESMNMKRPSNNYVELVTIDDFNFWFLGFVNYKKTLRYVHHAIGLHA